jgi:hypothetical protein
MLEDCVEIVKALTEITLSLMYTNELTNELAIQKLGSRASLLNLCRIDKLLKNNKPALNNLNRCNKQNLYHKKMA